MNFLEKNLEDILFTELEYCRSKGFSIEPYEKHVYRQLNLAPYGIADLIHIGRDQDNPIVRVRIIECKRNAIDAATYAQAARYQVAIQRILDCSWPEYQFEKVLVGQKIDTKNDFWALVAADPDCRVYTYQYRGDGILFKWHHNFSSFGAADAIDIFRPTTDKVMRDVNSLILPHEREEY